ncbi:hypothetical protein FOZ62_013831 [Perkinsus olseni]|uniref:Uncharacterized protein n=1 Tax=Perkinsus olseni TaxID=32597 RepID=A0A7J6R7Q6_PEROL|nr:hypothetical protein FOZ62_013831 [Perkinsus olseni]
MIDDKTVSVQSTDHIMYRLKFAHSEAASRFYHAIHAITEDDVFSHSSTRTQIGGGNSPSTNDQEALNPSDDEVSGVERLLK